MTRHSLYLLYAALWAVTICLFYLLKYLGGGSLAALAAFGPPVFLLYGFTLFLMDHREGSVGMSSVKAFLRRRRTSLILFFFGMIVLILLINRLTPAG